LPTTYAPPSSTRTLLMIIFFRMHIVIIMSKVRGHSLTTNWMKSFFFILGFHFCIIHKCLCLNMDGYSCEGFDDFIVTRFFFVLHNSTLMGIELQKFHLNELRQ
jgi:hypothetical protein